MKTIFVSSKCKFPIFLNSIDFLSLPSKIGLISTVQFSHLLPNLKKELEKKGKKVVIYNNPNILGCNALAAEKIQEKVDAFLFLSSGEFHVLHTATKINKPIFQFNPITREFSKFDMSKTKAIKERQEQLKKKFVLAKNIGILITTKPGQQKIKEAIKLKEILEKKREKNVFMFIANNLDLNQFENFPEISIYINTACPGLMLDSDKIINLEQVEEILNQKK